MVEVARGALQDHTDPPRALCEMANIPLKDAEDLVHKLFRKYHLTVPIPVTHIKLADEAKWPSYRSYHSRIGSGIC